MREFCDKIYVGFNGDNPKLEKLFKSYGSKVVYFKQKWENDFAKARNEVMDRTPDDGLIFWMDMDDALMIKKDMNMEQVRKEVFKIMANPDVSTLGAKTYIYVYNTTGCMNYSINVSLDSRTLTITQNTCS